MVRGYMRIEVDERVVQRDLQHFVNHTLRRLVGHLLFEYENIVRKIEKVFKTPAVRKQKMGLLYNVLTALFSINNGLQRYRSTSAQPLRGTPDYVPVECPTARLDIGILFSALSSTRRVWRETKFCHQNSKRKQWLAQASRLDESKDLGGIYILNCSRLLRQIKSTIEF